MIPASTRYNFDHFELLSALQKSIRRSDPLRATFYAAEFMLSGQIQALYRRLLLYADEDIGLADPYVLPRLLEHWRTIERYHDKQGFPWKEPSPKAQKKMIRMILELVQAPKSRLVDHAYWVGHLGLLESTEAQVLHTMVHAPNPMVVFDYLDLSGELIQARKKAFKLRRKEQGSILHVVAATLIQHRGARSSSHQKISRQVVRAWWAQAFRAQAFRAQAFRAQASRAQASRLPIPDWALDRHTRRGKALGRGWRHFFDVGAQITPNPYPDEYREIVRLHFLMEDGDVVEDE